MASRSLNIKRELDRDLRDPNYAARYLSEALQDGDEVVFKTALADVTRVCGAPRIARKAHINRATVYKTLRPGTASSFATVVQMLGACGLRFRIEPVGRRKRA